MRENFDRSLALVLTHEGGWSDHPQDPGGATWKGITLATYRGWAGNNRLTKAELHALDDEAIGKIYRERYWNAVKGDQLPAGLDYAVFDFGVNSGPSRAAKFLQTAIGAAPDGLIGADTLRAIERFGARQAVVTLCAARLTWLQGLKTWATFGRGWGRRVGEVESAALAMLGAPAAPQAPMPRPRPAPAPQSDPEDATRGDDADEGWIIRLLRRLLPFLFRE